MEKFILLATQRSGTGFLSSLLTSHPEIHVYPELLLWQDFMEKDNYFHFWRKKVKKSAVNITPPGQKQVLSEFFDTTFKKKKNCKIVGMNIKYDQLAIIPDQMHILNRKFNKVIHLIRKNSLKTLISTILNIRKEQLGRKSHSTEKYAPHKITLPIDQRLLNDLAIIKRSITENRNRFKNLFKDNYLEIYYEDFFDPNSLDSGKINSGVLKRIYDFFAIDYNFNLKTDLIKTNPDNLQDLLNNYSESKLFLELNGWEYLFHNPIVSPGNRSSSTDEYELVIHDLQNNNLMQVMNKLKPLYEKNPLNPEIVRLFINTLFRLDMKTQAAKVYGIFQKSLPENNDVSEAYNFLMNNNTIYY